MSTGDDKGRKQVELGTLAAHAKQCQTCFKTEEDVKLLSCQGCKRSHYCSKACQTADWPSHKVHCRNNRQVQEALKSKQVQPTTDAGLDVAACERAYRKWIQIHKPAIYWALTQSLELFNKPRALLTDGLAVTLDAHPAAFADEMEAAFTLREAEVIPLSTLHERLAKTTPSIIANPLGGDVIADLLKRSTAHFDGGGGGYGVTVLLVHGSPICHVLPCGFEVSPTTADFTAAKDWRETLAVLLRNGIKM